MTFVVSSVATGCMDDHFYADTRMFRFVRDAITKNQCVLIHGEAGCGKSALMNHVARSLQQNDYVLKPVTKFSDIDPDTSLESKTLYLFDDAFGIFNCDISFIDTLEHYSDVEVLLRHKHSKLLLTSRSSVYRKIEKFNFSVVFHVIDLNDPTLSLNNDEKKGIIQSICRKPSAEYLDKAGKCEHNSFPLLCVLFSDYHGLQESPHNFFVNPNKAFLSFLDTLQNTEILTYYSLVFVALNGRIRSPLDYANDSNVNEKLIFVKQACTQHCNENFSFEDLAKEIKKLVEDTHWFKKDDCDLYIFRHTFVYEIVAYHYGKNNIKDILACVGCSFIAEKILLENEINEEYPTHLTLLVDIEKLQERLLADIRDMENFDVFTNACWENSSFCKTFQRTLQEFTKLDIDELFWGSKYAQIVTSTCIYGTKLSEKKEKGYISLRHNESEWFRQKLLEDRSEKVIENSIQFGREIKAISWVIGYNISEILSDILNIKKGNRKIKPESVFDSIEQIRLLTLAILSENEDCFDIVLNYVDLQNINSNCLSSSSLDQPTYNKHRKFTPLTIACYKGFSAAIRKLVERGCEVNLKDQNGSMPLVLACRFASYSDCMYLVQKGTNLNCTNKSGVTPLIASIMSRNADIVNFLLENNVAINQCTVRGKSPLYYAAKRGCSEIVGILIKKEASVNICDKAGKSPLYWTAQNGYLNIAKILIDNNADVNQCDSKGKSPLYCASKRGHLKIVKLLIQKDADVNITTDHNKTSLYRAAKRGYTDICKVLIEKHANVNKTDRKGCTPLYWASKRGHFDIVIILLKSKASPNNKNDKEKAALHCAAQAGYVDIAKELVNYGADIHIEDVRRRTPLYCASKRGHVDMVKYLIKCGCDSSINTPTVKSKSALFRAAKRNHVDVLKELIANKADVNLSDENGESPLYFASKRGHLEVVRILLQAKANVNISCKNKQTALYWASQGRYSAIAALLVKHGADIHHKADRDKTALYCASKRGDLNIVKLLVQKGADINCRNYKNQTPLLRACKRNHLQVVKYLLDHRADVNLKDVNGETPLLWAAENGHFDVVEVLCKSNCYINESNVKRQTPIYRAAKYGHTDIVKHLLINGADKTIADKYGHSPVEMAQRMEHMGIVQILR